MGSSRYEPSETRIFTMAADGADVKVVPNTEGVGLYPPVWSPDGERLAFTVYGGRLGLGYNAPKRILYTIRIDGSELSRIGEVSTLPTWSADSERLAFGLTPRHLVAVNSILASIPFDSTVRMRVRSWICEYPKRLGLQSTPPFSRCRGPQDGSELLIASDLLFTVRPDGSDLRAFSQLGLALIVNATWSPDGSWIAVEQSVSPYYPDFWAYVVSVMTRNGTDVTIVAEGDSDEGSDPFIRQYTPPLPSAACSAGVVVPEPGRIPAWCRTARRWYGPWAGSSSCRRGRHWVGTRIRRSRNGRE